jgi:L-amino acid N-acyltransferase YncA
VFSILQPIMSIAIRPCEAKDVSAVNSILRHYVKNTVITFALIPSTDEEIAEKLKTLNQAGFPFIVAQHEASKRLLGYCYASPFRGNKGGYVHSAEFSLFVDKDHHGQGLGTKLLKTLIEILTHPEQHAVYFPNEARQVAVLIAVMAVDVEGKDDGLGLMKYYEKLGFTFVGRMLRVGHKFDKW